MVTAGQMYLTAGQMCLTAGQMCLTAGQMCLTAGQMCLRLVDLLGRRQSFVSIYVLFYFLILYFSTIIPR